MRILIVHGERPSSDKELHPAFEERLKLAALMCQKNNYDLLVITGGKTKKKFQSEAEIGRRFLEGKIHTPFLLEGRAVTSVENINFTKKLLQRQKIDSVDIITSQTRIFRLKYLYKKLWPEIYAVANLYGAKDFYSPFFVMGELIYDLYTHVDIQEKYLARIAKRFFRNHQENLELAKSF